jgi:hypothetical protein
VPEWKDLSADDVALLRVACEKSEEQLRGTLSEHDENFADEFRRLSGWLFDMVREMRERKGWK